jgi:hypothetical protein
VDPHPPLRRRRDRVEDVAPPDRSRIFDRRWKRRTGGGCSFDRGIVGVGKSPDNPPPMGVGSHHPQPMKPDVLPPNYLKPDKSPLAVLDGGLLQ